MEVFGFIKKWIQHLLFRRKLKKMDDWWYFFGGSTYDVIPPSYYYTHTKEEIDAYRKREYGEIRQMLEEYKTKYCRESDDESGENKSK